MAQVRGSVANDELSALRHVATLAAEGVTPSDLFAVVAEEVARVVNVPRVSVARYELDGTATDCASFPPGAAVASVDNRWSLAGTNVLALVRTTAAAARIDDYAQLDGALAEAVRRIGIRSTVGTPIVVAGRLWGAMIASTMDPDPLPGDTAERLASFTELLATAIANAESREALGRLADMQAGLRRVAELVAREVSPAEVFSAVAEEMARCLDVDNASVCRYEADAVVIAAFSASDVRMPSGLFVGERFPLDGDHIGAMVLRTGRSARVDSHQHASGAAAARIRELGVQCAVGVPIVVSGHLWGMAAVTSRAEPLPTGIERGMADFADLVATAIANAATRAELQARRDELQVLADQQAALRRVATLVAHGVEPTEVLSAVATELAWCLGVYFSALWRYQPDGSAVLVAACDNDPGVKTMPVGTRFSLAGDNVPARVLRTSHPARIDNYENARGPAAARLRELGLRAAVGAPIIVDGRVWGAAIVGSSRPGPLPQDTEERVEDFTDLIATAIANAETHTELTASRARIVAAADAARRRIERDLHDGAQQRLVSLGLEMRAAEASMPPGLHSFKEQISHFVTGLAGISADLQEISRGIHPAILSRGGLGPALKTLARRSSVPVELDVGVDQRLPDSVEVAAYYVVAETLTNAAKHARASEITVRVKADGANLHLLIRDDGIGGADTAKGSGLTGLVDRVEALGGQMTISSQPGRGTSLAVKIPLDAA
jgi:signal transduction histidine kinase